MRGARFFRWAALSGVRSESGTGNWWRNSGVVRDALVSVGERARKSATGWLCWQAPANCSPFVNSLITGKIEGISSILGPSSVTRPLQNNRLAAKFPKARAGNFSGKQGALLRQEGILQGSHKEEPCVSPL